MLISIVTKLRIDKVESEYNKSEWNFEASNYSSQPYHTHTELCLTTLKPALVDKIVEQSSQFSVWIIESLVNRCSDNRSSTVSNAILPTYSKRSPTVYQSLTLVTLGKSVFGAVMVIGLCTQAFPVPLTQISSTLICRDGMVNPNSLWYL